MTCLLPSGVFHHAREEESSGDGWSRTMISWLGEDGPGTGEGDGTG